MASVMTAWDYAVCGFFGGFVTNGLEFAGASRRLGGWPRHQLGGSGPLPLAASVLSRLANSTGHAAAAGTTGQVSGPFGAPPVGLAAPPLIEQFGLHGQLAAARTTIAIVPAPPINELLVASTP
jgi:hypothetical protein